MGTKMESADILQDLRLISQAGRERILRRLSREDIIEILKAAFHKLDDAQEQRKAADRTLPTAGDDHVEGRSESKPEPDNLFAEVHVETHIPDYSVTLVSTEKQARTDTILRVTEIQPQADSMQRVGRYMAIKSEWDAKGYNDNESDDLHEEVQELGRDGTFRNKEANVLSTAPPAYELAIRTRNGNEKQGAPHISQTTMFPIMLSVPTANDEVTLKSIDELSPDIRTTLENSFEKMRSASKHRILRHQGLMKNPKYYAKKPVCIRDTLVCTKGDFSFGATFRETGKASADVRCIKAREPCTYLIMINNDPLMCMVPLPEIQRVGKAWTELGYWIRD